MKITYDNVYTIYDTIVCETGVPTSDIITAIQNYLPTDDFIEFVEYLVKEYDLDETLEQYLDNEE